MTIEWFYPNKNLPIITLASYGMSFNIGAISYLKHAESVEIGYNTEKKEVLIKINKSGQKGFTIPEINEQKKTVRINCKDFIQYLEAKHKLDLSASKKYHAEYVEEKELIVFNLNHAIKDNKKKRRDGE